MMREERNYHYGLNSKESESNNLERKINQIFFLMFWKHVNIKFKPINQKALTT